MCRFLIARSEQEGLDASALITEFASMCERTPAPDGDWQGDGWGVAWRDESGWQVKKSLSPIWKELRTFGSIPPTQLLAVHARSAGFPQHKGIIDHNQPYIGDGLCFVFNGMLRGVSVPMELEGAIGAQKIFSFLKREIVETTTDQALRTLDSTFLTHSRKIDGMNIGVIKDNTLFALCEYADNEDYFSLRYCQDPALTMVCSTPLPEFHWQKMEKGQVLVL